MTYSEAPLPRSFFTVSITIFLAGWLSTSTVAAEQPTAEQLEFFESKIRPALAGNCYSCHGTQTKTPFANLRLDSLAGILKGGDAGPAVVPGDPGASRLIQALRYASTVKMPPTGKLPEEQISSFVKWVEIGAPWPLEQAPEAAGPKPKFDLEARKREHWAWQPLKRSPPPAASNSQWSDHPVDRFLLAKLEEKELSPAKPANRYILFRRLSFDLTGLPPTPRQIESFVHDDSEGAYERLVDRLLHSPRFGERWARRWMDLVRYTESHGSEGDPDVPLAWRYRDYLVRAFNNDVPYDQLVREHLAGDLIENPRWNEELRINESIIGTAHMRMIEHGFQPVDPLEDRVKWTDNQIDVFSKAFQGLTVSCARCHDHKFDAISQKDFYSLFGVFAGARPIQVTIDSPGHLNKNRSRLGGLKRQIKNHLADSWEKEARYIQSRLEGAGASYVPIERAACDDESPLSAWVALSGKRGEEFSDGWSRLAEHWRKEAGERKKFNHENFEPAWDLTGDDYSEWLRAGVGLPEKPSRPGEFWVQTEGDRVINGVYPAGVYTHLLSRKHNGVLSSPRFKIESDSVSLRLLGDNFSFARLMIENYAVPRAGIYGQKNSPKKDRMQWYTWDTTFWQGFDGYIEFATLDDLTNFALDPIDNKRRPRPKPKPGGRSFFGADRIVFHTGKETPKEEVAPILHLLEGEAPASAAELADRLRRLLLAAIDAWREGTLSEKQAAFLDDFVRKGFLPNLLDKLEELRPMVAEYRRLEEEVPVARRAPGLLDESGPDQPLLIRGNHKNPGDRVPRGFLEAFGKVPYEDPGTVRLRLANDVVSPDNPLTSRVMVNRVWYYLFGRGIVSTVDNFGKVGKRPTHPELLDYLAARFVRRGWSIKDLVRFLVTTRAYQMDSRPSERAAITDPGNEFLQHMPIRRLEAESIRDSVLAVSGQLDLSMHGPSIKTYFSFDAEQAKGVKDKGPLDGARRRSVYLEIRRNVTNPFLEVFDAPKPASTRGQRDITNVPAQSLTLLNDPFVIEQAAKWAESLLADPALANGKRLEHMFLKALGRKPSPLELDKSQTFLASLAQEHGVQAHQMNDSPLVWRDFAQSMFNFKEFLYLQ